MSKKFRALRPDEVEVRVGTCSEKGYSLLLYKDARCDNRILDETVHAENWQDSYTTVKDVLYCTVSIWDEKKQQWIAKQNCGTESNTEKEKGEASDAFKRACFNWGIGRELYSAPFIWIQGGVKRNEKTNRWEPKERLNLHVTDMDVDTITESITRLVIKDNKGIVAFSHPNHTPKPPAKPDPIKDDFQSQMDKTKMATKEQVKEIEEKAKKAGKGDADIQKVVGAGITAIQAADMIKRLNAEIKKMGVA